MKNLILTLLVVPFFVFGKEEATYKQNFDTKSAKIQVTNINGEINLKKSSSGKIEITAFAKTSKTFEKQNLDITNWNFIEVEDKGNTFSITIKTCPTKKNCNNDLTVDLNIAVPEGKSLHITSVNGNISSDAPANKVSFTTVNGDILLQSDASDCMVSTTNGDIKLQLNNQIEKVQCKTVNGDIQVAVKKDESNSFEYATLNGKVHSDLFAVNLPKGDIHVGIKGSYGDSNRKIKLNTVNGNLKFTEL